jgi:hypothetical protein
MEHGAWIGIGGVMQWAWAIAIAISIAIAIAIAIAYALASGRVTPKLAPLHRFTLYPFSL